MPDHHPWLDRLRERLAREGLTPSAHREAIEEIADHLNDVHRAALAEGKTVPQADTVVEAELARIGPLAAAVSNRATRRGRQHPDAGGWRAGLLADGRHAVRAVRLERGFSAIVVLTLAIGIGACTAVFSIINALLLGSLPYPDPGQLVLVVETDRANRPQSFIVAYPNYQDWRRESTSFSAMGIWEYQTFNIASAAEPEQVQGVRASSSLFTVLGVPPALGRVFTEAEDAPGHHVVVISDGVWRNHFGGHPAAIGSTLRLNGEPYEVIGVMPRGFQFPWRNNGVWVPFGLTEQDQQRGSHSFWVAARLKDGTAFESGRAEIEQIGRALAQKYEENADEGATITPMSDQGMRILQPMLIAVMGAVSLVLLIACVNVANLQLGRALTRRREFVLRLSLGAGFGRLARQLFAESLVLAAASGIGGVLLAWIAARAADVVLTPGFRVLPFRGEVPIVIDGRVLAFAATAAVMSAATFGFAPLIGLRRRDPAALLREGERGSTGAAHTARRALVAIEIALAIVVLSGAGLLVKSLAGLMQVHPGLDPREVLTLQLSLPQEDTYGPPERQSFCTDLTRSAEGLPGILRIGAISHLPLSGANAGRAVSIEGRPQTAPDSPAATYRLSCPGYFGTLGIPMIEGRDFSDRDVTNGEKVAIVNRAMAEAYWPGQSPLGKRMKIGALQNDNPWMVVVGVVDNIRHFGLDSEARREFYAPYSQLAWPVMTVVAKTVGEPMLWQASLRGAIRHVDPDLPVAGVRSMESVITSSVSWRETPMRLLTGFAVIGLLLASLGVYGVLAYYVSQRTREIGVRAALGATRGQLAGLVLRQSMPPIAAGVALGIAGSFATGQLLQQFLYQVRPGDPAVIAVMVIVLTGVGLLASWLPARRAASIDPVIALRDE
jgi:putative ABC transport system permease protein